MMAPEDVVSLIESLGFECHGFCSAGTLRAREDVRDMCASGRCGMYGKNWSCPPACGEIEDCSRLLQAHRDCYVVQTIRNLEDEFDVETMMEAERIQKTRMLEFASGLREAGAAPLVLTSGACTLCRECSYPAHPCRFPDKQHSSLEAFGIMVSEVCAAAGVAYTHGAGTIAYTGAVLL